LAEHCRHARFVWNLAVEQQRHWQPGRQAPGYHEQCAQLTAARAEYDWLAAGSQTVQQQALRDFAQAMRSFFHGTHRRPTWREAGTHEGFRQVGLKPSHLQRLSRRDWVEKTTTDLARHVDTIRVEDLNVRAMTRSARGTRDCPGTNVAQKRALNREIHRHGWGLLVARLKHKASGRLEFVPAAYTSQRCSHCGHVAPENRKSQAVFQCVACGAGPCNADVNAARNIAAGRAVTARGDLGTSRSANREPQLCSPAA
jgi:transposase